MATDRKDFSDKTVQKVWEKADPISGKDPDKVRRDSKGNEIHKKLYGTKEEKGWEIDHKQPLAKGGTNKMDNLQPLQNKCNREKGDKY